MAELEVLDERFALERGKTIQDFLKRGTTTDAAPPRISSSSPRRRPRAGASGNG